MTTILTNKQKTILNSFTRYRSSIDEESYYKYRHKVSTFV